MEFANENSYLLQNRTNLKNISSPFLSSKKSNKTALSDVKNVIHQKNIKGELSNWNSSQLKDDLKIVNNEFKDSKSPKLRNKSISKVKEAALNKMEDEFFICVPCSLSENYDDNFENIIPENLRLTKDEIHIFATRGSNYIPEFDLSISPMKLDTDFLDTISLHSLDISDDNPSFIDMLNESFEIVPVVD